jgi:hypothetical protein
MKAKPKENYQLLGTSTKLDKTKVYDVEFACNIPDGDVFKMIWIEGVLLKEGEYEIVKN